MSRDSVYSCLLRAVSDRVYEYNSMYPGELLVEVETMDDGTFMFVFDCLPDIEYEAWLSYYIHQIDSLVIIANTMIKDTKCV